MVFIIIISLLFSIGIALFSLYTTVLRYVKVKDLPNDILTESEKEAYMKELMLYMKIVTGCLFIPILTSLLPLDSMKFIPPIISILISGKVLYKIFDEIEDFDINKKDLDILKDFLSSITEDSKEKSKNDKIKALNSSMIKVETEEEKKKYQDSNIKDE